MRPMKIAALKVHFFLVYAVLGAMMPYLPVYCREVGLTESQIGWVIGIYGFAVLVGPPVYTLLADRFASNRLLIGIGYLITAATIAATVFSVDFVPLLVVHLLFSLGFTAMIPMLDGLAFSVIRAPSDEQDPGAAPPPYRSIRIWGSFGWMAPGFALWALVWLKLDALAVCIIAMIAAMTFALAGWIGIDRLPERKIKNKGGALPTTEALRIVTRPPVLWYMVALLLLFLSGGMYYPFYPVHLDNLGVPSAFYGLITNLGVLVECVFMVKSGWLIRRFGLRWLMVIGCAAMAVRLALLAEVHEPWVAIATQVFHGPAVIALYLLPPMYLDTKAEERYRSSIHGIRALLIFGVARLVGAGVGGHLGEVSLATTFWVGAALSAGAAVMFVALFRDDDPQVAAAMRLGERD